MAATVESLPSAWPQPPGGFELPHLGEADSCLLCPAGSLASVQLRPCVPKLCARCAEHAPARDGLKVDTGVRCPLCSQFAEEFVPLTGEVMGIDDTAIPNVPTSMAAMACTPDQKLGLGDGLLVQEFWKCLHCHQAQNSVYTDMCKDCGRLRPDNMMLHIPKGKDIINFDLGEILAACQAKWHPNLNRAFLEAGVPMINGVVQGDRESIIASFKKSGQEKLVKIVRTIAGSCRIHELCQNLFANYAIQDLLEAMSKLREAARDEQLNLPQTATENLLAITSSFGLLFNNVLETLCETSMHPTGFHLVRSLIRVCNLEELCSIASAFLPRCMEIASNEKGCYVLNNLMESLIDFQKSDCDSYQVAKAKAAVNNIASAMYERFQMMTWIACNSPISESLLLNVVQGSLPLYSGLQVGSFLASYAHELVQTKKGIQLVLVLLSMNHSDSRDIVRDLVCCTALSLQGSIASYAAFEPVDGLRLIQVLIQRLVDEGEIDWATVITKELMAQGEDLLQDEHGREVLLFALSLKLIQPQATEMFVKKMASQGLETQVLQDLALLDGCENRHMDRSSRAHWRSSIISPWLKFHIDSGNEILAPPAVPPHLDRTFGRYQHVQPPRPESSQRNYMVDCQGSMPGIKSSIWADNLGFPPAPPMPKSYHSLTSVPEHTFALDHPPSAKLPADLMESLNSESPETSTDIDRISGRVEFGEIPAPPPAMYQYPGNWNFPDMGSSELGAAELDVSGVVDQFQGSMLSDHQKFGAQERISGASNSPSNIPHSDVIGIGDVQRSEGVPATQHRMFVSTPVADAKPNSLDCDAMGGGGLWLKKGPTWEGQVQDIVGVHKANGRSFGYNKISRDQVSFFDPDLCF